MTAPNNDDIVWSVRMWSVQAYWDRKIEELTGRHQRHWRSGDDLIDMTSPWVYGPTIVRPKAA